jgi:hypothetical protein
VAFAIPVDEKVIAVCDADAICGSQLSQGESQLHGAHRGHLTIVLIVGQLLSCSFSIPCLHDFLIRDP